MARAADGDGKSARATHGYRISLVDQEGQRLIDQLDYTCAICSEIVRAASHVGECQFHVFCRTCLEEANAVKTITSCPECRKPCSAGDFKDNRFLDFRIGQLNARCIFESCEWKGMLKDQASSIE